MNILGLTFTDLDFSLNSKFINADYTIRYTAFIDDYDQDYKFYFESETVNSFGTNYRVLYESKTDLDYLDFKIRYTAFESLNSKELEFKVRYEIEQPIEYVAMYRAKYESEGVETYSVRKIYRTYYETETVIEKGQEHKIRYNSEPPILKELEYEIKYESTSYHPLQLSYTLLRRVDGTIDLLIGFYTTLQNVPDYKLFNNATSSLMYEIEEDDLRVDYLEETENIVSLDIAVRDKFVTYTPSGYLRIKDVNPSYSMSLDVYNTDSSTCQVNESRSVFFKLDPQAWVSITLEEGNEEYVAFNSEMVSNVEMLNTLPSLLFVEITKRGMICCYGRKVINKSANSCSP